MALPARPTPKGEDAARWKHTALRLRMLLGQWRDDGYRALARVFGKARVDEMGELDMSRNPFKSIMGQVSVSYDDPPSIQAEGIGDVSGMLGPFILGLLQRHELYVNGLRESVIRLDVVEGKVTARLVTANEIAYCGAAATTPHLLNKVEELRPRDIPFEMQALDGRGSKITEEWTWEVWDWSDPKAPIFKVLSADRKTDRTAIYFPKIKPGDVPYYDGSNVGIFPYILYHAETHGGLFDWETGKELIDGSLRVAVGWTGAHHGFAEASWPQRWAKDVELQGSEIKGKGEERRAEITVAPTSILMVQSIGNGNGDLGQFEPGIDVKVAGEFLSQVERDLAIWAGLSPGDLQATGDAQSGYSISVSRAGLRRKQAKVQPNLRMADQLMLATAARLLNKYGKAPETYPEEPELYSVVYKGIPLSLEETKALIDQIEAKRAAGVASRLDVVIALEPGLNRAQALDRLVQVAKEEAEIDAAIGPFKPKAPPMPPSPTPNAPSPGGDQGQDGGGTSNPEGDPSQQNSPKG